MSAVIFPFLTNIGSEPGSNNSFGERYVKPFKDVFDIYSDRTAANKIDPDSVAYEVQSNSRTNSEGDLIFGVTVLNPGLVGEEFRMTRGHLHELSNRAEIYYCLSGNGVMLMDDSSGKTEAVPMSSGDIVYVPGHWIHRSVNVGDTPLVTLFCFSSDAGQNYSIIGEYNGMAMKVVTDGRGGWQLSKNESYVRFSTDEYRPDI